MLVPVSPPELKQLAIQMLRVPYRRAKYVIVLDNYLRQIARADLTINDLMALVNCSSWTTRVWTLQEGRLANTVLFAMEDGLTSLESLYSKCDTKLMNAYEANLFGTQISSWYATNMFEDSNAIEH